VITTPHKERLEKIQSVLFEARRLQVLADKAPGKTENSSVYYLLGYDMIELNLTALIYLLH